MCANWSKAECAPTFRLLTPDFRRCSAHRLHMARPPTSMESQTVSSPTPRGDRRTIENIAKISNGALLLPRARNWKGILPACFHSSLKGGRRVAQRESLRRKRVRTHSICARSEISYVAIRNQNALWRQREVLRDPPRSRLRVAFNRATSVDLRRSHEPHVCVRRRNRTR